MPCEEDWRLPCSSLTLFASDSSERFWRYFVHCAVVCFAAFPCPAFLPACSTVPSPLVLRLFSSLAAMPPKKKGRLPKMTGPPFPHYDVEVLTAAAGSHRCAGCAKAIRAGEMMLTGKQLVFYNGRPSEDDSDHLLYRHHAPCFEFWQRAKVLSDDRTRIRALARRMGLDERDCLRGTSREFYGAFTSEILASRFRGFETVGKNNQVVLRNIMHNGKYVEGSNPVQPPAAAVDAEEEDAADEPAAAAAAAAAPASSARKATAASRKKVAAGSKRKAAAAPSDEDEDEDDAPAAKKPHKGAASKKKA